MGDSHCFRGHCPAECDMRKDPFSTALHHGQHLLRWYAGSFWMVMVAGHKRWTLFHPDDVALLYPSWHRRGTLAPTFPSLAELEKGDYPHFQRARRTEVCALKECVRTCVVSRVWMCGCGILLEAYLDAVVLIVLFVLLTCTCAWHLAAQQRTYVWALFSLAFSLLSLPFAIYFSLCV